MEKLVGVIRESGIAEISVNAKLILARKCGGFSFVEILFTANTTKGGEKRGQCRQLKLYKLGAGRPWEQEAGNPR